MFLREWQNVKEATSQKGHKRGKIGRQELCDLAGSLPRLIFIQLQKIEGLGTGGGTYGWNRIDLKVLSLATDAFEERKDKRGRTIEPYYLSSFTAQCQMTGPASAVQLGGSRGINYTIVNS